MPNSPNHAESVRTTPNQCRPIAIVMFGCLRPTSSRPTVQCRLSLTRRCRPSLVHPPCLVIHVRAHVYHTVHSLRCASRVARIYGSLLDADLSLPHTGPVTWLSREPVEGTQCGIVLDGRR